MSKLDTLKKQNPDLDISLIDVLGLVYKTKYVEMYLNIYKAKKSKEANINEDMTSFQMEMVDMGFDKEYVTELSKELNLTQQHFVGEFIGDLGYRDMRSFNKFIELNERGLIENKDVTSYKTMEDVLGQISIAEIKSIDKELEKLVLKLHDDGEWLIIKPLTYESSKKYGAGTRWCTASDSEAYQFYNYTSRGNLIYTMNKKTGYKLAAFKNLDKEYTRELSFWDAEDNRLDSLELNLPNDIMDVITTDLRNCQQSNYHLAPDEIRAINDEAKDEKKLNRTLRSLGELLDGHDTPGITYDIRDNGEYTITTTNDILPYEPQQG